jgi:hypothetical protein
MMNGTGTGRRRCLIGLSSATSFNPRAARKRQPTPIFEAPLGLFLLYDEIWFLHENLCPWNMRRLPYVRFLNQEPGWADAKSIARDLQRPEFGTANEFQASALFTYARVFRRAAPEGCPPVECGPVAFSPSPLSLDNLVFDSAVATALDLDLVTNSMTNYASAEFFQVHRTTHLTTLMLAESLPHVYGKWGPYSPRFRGLIDQFRAADLLQQFRHKVVDACESQSEAPVSGLKQQLEAALVDAMETTFLAAFDHKKPVLGYANAVIGQVPVVSNLVSVVLGAKDVIDYHVAKRKIGWAGFLVSARRFARGWRRPRSS